MVANIKIEDAAPIVDRTTDLEAEIAELEAEIRRLSHRLDEERAHRAVLERAVGFATARARALERDEVRTGARPRFEGRADGDVLELDEKRENSGSADENTYVFDDEDESRAAFDRFFAAPDPHLDKVRGFLLD